MKLFNLRSIIVFAIFATLATAPANAQLTAPVTGYYWTRVIGYPYTGRLRKPGFAWSTSTCSPTVNYYLNETETDISWWRNGAISTSGFPFPGAGVPANFFQAITNTQVSLLTTNIDAGKSEDMQFWYFYSSVATYYGIQTAPNQTDWDVSTEVVNVVDTNGTQTTPVDWTEPTIGRLQSFMGEDYVQPDQTSNILTPTMQSITSIWTNDNDNAATFCYMTIGELSVADEFTTEMLINTDLLSSLWALSPCLYWTPPAFLFLSDDESEAWFGDCTVTFIVSAVAGRPF
jgi:hypothetical protein